MQVTIERLRLKTETLLRIIGCYEDDRAATCSDVANPYSEWLITRLSTFGMLEDSTSLFQPFLLNGDEVETQGQRSERMLGIFISIASYLSSKADCSLQDVVDALLAKEMLSGDPDLETLRYQLVFACIGHLTLVYSALLDPQVGVFELAHPSAARNPVRCRTARSRRKSWLESQCEIDEDAIEQPLRHLYASFGRLIPRPLPSGPIQPSEPLYADALIGTNLNFYTFTKVAQIKIRWVDSISNHLEFEPRRSVLSIFRFPSFCAALCWNKDADQTFLSE